MVENREKDGKDENQDGLVGKVVDMLLTCHTNHQMLKNFKMNLSLTPVIEFSLPVDGIFTALLALMSGAQHMHNRSIYF